MKPTNINNLTGRNRRQVGRVLSGIAISKIVLIMLLIFTFGAGSGDPQEFDIPWFSIDGGGGMSEGGPFSVTGTIGQPDAGTMTGGEFEFSGGFWSLPTSNAASGDCNSDGVVNMSDFACFLDCSLAPDGGLLPDCALFDFDDDGDVDLRDFGSFQTLFGD